MNGTSPLHTFALAVALVVLLFTSGCSAVKEVKVGMEMNGKEIQLKPGEVLAVRLESNPTTGYSWQVEQSEPAVLQPAGDPTFESANAGQHLAGAGGWQTFRFKAVKAGQTDLKLVYQRSWEPGIAPAQTFEVRISVP